MSKIKQYKDRVVAHVGGHKETYIASSVTALLAIAGTLAVTTSGPKAVQLSPLSFAYKSTLIQFVERSTPSKPVHLVGTQQYFDSVHDAARKTGHSLAMISRNVNGHIPSVRGDVFEAVQTA
jgi:hypothetical protein